MQDSNNLTNDIFERDDGIIILDDNEIEMEDYREPVEREEAELRDRGINEDSDDDWDDNYVQEVEIDICTSCCKPKRKEVKMYKIRKQMTSALLENEEGEFIPVISAKQKDLDKRVKYRCICFERFLKYIFKPCRNIRKPMPLFLVILGLSAACLAISMDLVVTNTRTAVSNITVNLTKKKVNFYLRMFVWFLFSLGFIGFGGFLVVKNFFFFLEQ